MSPFTSNAFRPLRRTALGMLSALACFPHIALRAQEDPISSPIWPTLRTQYLGQASGQFSDALQLIVPPAAEDGLNVPMLIDARALTVAGKTVREIIAVVDLNPEREVFRFYPLRVLPLIGCSFRIEQTSPVRALVRTHDDHWFLAAKEVAAIGGGCTQPSQSGPSSNWEETLNQVQARLFYVDPKTPFRSRLRVKVMHPMDTGFVAGIPPFYLEELRVTDGNGETWLHLVVNAPVSENPLFTFELAAAPTVPLFVEGRDTGGNRWKVEISA